MRRKEPKPNKWKIHGGFKALLVGEVVLFVGSYYLWTNMNSSRDFRYKMHQNFPRILNGYYAVGEKLSYSQTRRHDYEAWGINK